MANTKQIKEFRMNHKQIEKECTLVYREIQPVGRRSAELSQEDFILFLFSRIFILL